MPNSDFTLPARFRSKLFAGSLLSELSETRDYPDLQSFLRSWPHSLQCELSFLAPRTSAPQTGSELSLSHPYLPANLDTRGRVILAKLPPAPPVTTRCPSPAAAMSLLRPTPWESSPDSR